MGRGILLGLLILGFFLVWEFGVNGVVRSKVGELFVIVRVELYVSFFSRGV